jgi:hypothetical protein
MSFYNSSSIFFGCFITLLICILFGAFGGWVFMMLWNWLAPLFWTNAPILTFWEAWGVMILISWLSSFFRNNSK